LGSAVTIMPMHRADPVLPLAVLAIGACLTAFALAGFFERESQADFTMFYDSGRAWNSGSPPYTTAHANLNPPSVVALVFAPLARLSYRTAQTVWVLAGALALAASLRVIVRELALPVRQTICLVAALSVTYPWCLAWFGGQVSFLLMFPFTKAWAAFRSGSFASAGAWMAPVIAVKPPFALLALLLPLRVWTTAGVLSAAASAFAVLLTGWTPWLEWMELGSQITWLSWADNASLWGIFTRARSGYLGAGSLSDVPTVVKILLILVAAAGAVRVWREGNADRRMALSLVWLLLVTPLGWVYYVLVGAGAIRASWVPSLWAWTGLALLVVQLPIIYPLLTARWMVATLGSTYAAALLCLWIALAIQPSDDRPSLRTRSMESTG
jgi:hypothetical protein